MKLRDIPIRTVGPGSQPEEPDGAQLEYIDMPKGVSTYSVPDTPEADEVKDLLGTKEAMDWLLQALDRYEPDGDPLMANITRLDDKNRELDNQILGDGEVSAKYTGVVRARMQEAVLAGVWRTFYLDDTGNITHDLIEVADVPYLIRMPASRDADPLARLRNLKAPDGIMNAMPIVTEVLEHAEQFPITGKAHSINLTLLPLSEEDIEFLESAFGQGPVDLLSRGYGDCRVRSTKIPNVWWVRFFNSMGTVILDTLEIIDVPGVACAAKEDIRDSKTRLEDILAPYWKEIS